MKEKETVYEKAEIEIILFEPLDVLTTSGGDWEEHTPPNGWTS